MIEFWEPGRPISSGWANWIAVVPFHHYDMLFHVLNTPLNVNTRVLPQI